MTGESQGRPTQRMSRFSQAHRGPQAGAMEKALDDRAESVLSRADTVNDTVMPPWPSLPDELPFAEVIEVEFETVPPAAAAPEAAAKTPEHEQPNGKREKWSSFRGRADLFQPNADPRQPPPPDIEAIAAALAAEMDRNAARSAQTVAETQEPDAAFAPRAEENEAEPSRAAVGEAEAEQAEVEEAEASEPELDYNELCYAVPDTLPQVAAPRRKLFPRGLAEGLQLARERAEYSRKNAIPALGRAGVWLARNLRAKEIRRRYSKALALVHGRLLDRRLERHFYVSTLAAERFAPAPDRGILYEGPVPAYAFAWVMSQLPRDLREFAFVDIRAARGRTMLLAAQRNFERIIGYEYDAASYDDLQMNIAQFPRSKMLCRDVQAYRGDRSGVTIPDQPCVLYVANAWREDLMSGVMHYVRSSFIHKPRRIYLILENSDAKLALPADDIFHRMELPFAEKLKLRLFSPMEFQLYRTAI